MTMMRAEASLRGAEGDTPTETDELSLAVTPSHGDET
jgi:hypothetical protein